MRKALFCGRLGQGLRKGHLLLRRRLKNLRKRIVIIVIIEIEGHFFFLSIEYWTLACLNGGVDSIHAFVPECCLFSFMYCDTILFFDLANLCSNEARTIIPRSSGCRKSIGFF